MKYIKYISLSLLALICLPAFSMEKKRPLETKENPLAKAPKVDDNSDDINEIAEQEDPELAALLELEFAQPITNEKPAHTNALQKDETTIADEETVAADDESTLMDKEPQKCIFPGCNAKPQKDLSKHMWNYHGRGAQEITCTECNKKIFQRILKDHTWRFHGGGAKETICEECNKQVLKRDLQNHKALHPKTTCEICKQEFLSACFNRHLKTHAMDKQDYFICKLCTKTEFTNRHSILRHLKKAHEIKAEFKNNYKKETRDV